MNGKGAQDTLQGGWGVGEAFGVAAESTFNRELGLDSL